jgi:hypothetical protein
MASGQPSMLQQLLTFAMGNKLIALFIVFVLYIVAKVCVSLCKTRYLESSGSRVLTD